MFDGTILLPALRIPAPGLHGTTGTDKTPVNVSVAVTAASTTEQALTGSAPTYWDRYVTVTAVGTDIYIAFGLTGMGAATAADWLITAGTKESFWIFGSGPIAGPGVVTHFRAIGVGTGTVNWAISS